jgi:SAM-dependent methyltransferase
MDICGKNVLMNPPKIEKNQTPYDIESEVERFHWWFVVRRKLLGSVLSFNIPRKFIALEVGCGTGANLKALESAGFYGIGLDRSLYALALVKKKGNAPLLAGDLNNLPIKTKSLGFIIAMDVFEHLEHDAQGINECYRVLDDGGILFLTVPAFRVLWGLQDNLTGHQRRYSKREITHKLYQAGFKIEKLSYYNFFIFFPIFGARLIIRLFGLKISSENRINFPLLNFFLKTVFSLETYLLKYIPFPFGVSIFCVAKKSRTA